MRASSADYIQALHDGNYLLFLSWPSFVMDKYNDAKSQNGADFLMDGLVFEWLHYNDYEKSVASMAILYAAYVVAPEILDVDKLPVCFTTLFSALFVCLTYQHYGIGKEQLPTRALSRKGVIEFMETLLTLTRTVTTEAEFQQQVSRTMDDFTRMEIPKIKPHIRDTAIERIRGITQLLSKLNGYISSLTIEIQTNKQNDNLCSTRLAVAERFFSFLQEQTGLLSEGVEEQILVYVTDIRSKQPKDWEEQNFLEHISPLGMAERITKAVTTTASRFSLWVLPTTNNGIMLPELDRTLQP